jgi:hypothetical protein
VDKRVETTPKGRFKHEPAYIVHPRRTNGGVVHDRYLVPNGTLAVMNFEFKFFGFFHDGGLVNF